MTDLKKLTRELVRKLKLEFDIPRPAWGPFFHNNGNPCFETALTMPVPCNLDPADMDPDHVKKIMNKLFLPFPEGTFVRWHMPYGGFACVQVRECAGNGHITVVHWETGALLRVRRNELHELSPLEKLALCADG